jgi:hypothetical protein
MTLSLLVHACGLLASGLVRIERLIAALSDDGHRSCTGVGVGVVCWRRSGTLKLPPPHPAVRTASAIAPRVELIKRMGDSIPVHLSRAGTIPGFRGSLAAFRKADAGRYRRRKGHGAVVVDAAAGEPPAIDDASGP